jgi:hypothetical protein
MLLKTCLFCLVIFLSCTADDIYDDETRAALFRASNKCGSSPDQLDWLHELIQRSEHEVTLQGKIYAIQVDGTTVIMHQPWIMSCLGCILYDCNGNRLDNSAVNFEKLLTGYNESNVIYSTSLD